MYTKAEAFAIGTVTIMAIAVLIMDIFVWRAM
jgi:hypothetical protein